MRKLRDYSKIKYNDDFAKTFYIEYIGFSCQTFNVLKRAKINTLYDLLEKEDVEISCIRGLGKTSYTEIITALSKDLTKQKDNMNYGFSIETIRNKLDKEFYDLPIHILMPSVRLYNCLCRVGISTIGDILKKEPEELFNIRNLGRMELKSLYDKLSNLVDISIADYIKKIYIEFVNNLKDEHREAIKMRNDGLPYRAIAAKFKVSGSYIQKITTVTNKEFLALESSLQSY